ncbi:MAG: DUF4893 domain-containing protein [Alphaproteobacteria bacterium]|nr:MAG: DUF4893 domain-containing protein [Alphaproteobacteria bacterium]
MPHLFRSSLLIAVAAAALAACATLAPPVPPVPPLPGQTAENALPDWRGIVTRADRDRFDRRDAAWRDALRQARSLSGSGDLASTGALIDPDAGINGVTPPVGDYRCRTVKLGSQGDYEGLGYVVYGWFACRIEDTPTGLKFVKRTGSQRPSGLLFPENDSQMVFLGSMSLGDEAAANSYGRQPDRDMIAVLERIGPARWRLVIPWPTAESKLDLIELVPA